MPTIKTYDVWFKGEKFRAVVKYTTKEGQFSIQLPSELADWCGYQRVTGTTEDEADKKLKKLLQDHKDKSKNRKKVIVYEIAMNAKIMRKTGNDDDCRCVMVKDDISFCHGTAISVQYDVLFEETYGGEETLHYDNGRHFMGTDYHNMKKIGWTEKREAFFENLKATMEELVIKVDAFFNDETKFLTAIDTGKFTHLLENKSE